MKIRDLKEGVYLNTKEDEFLVLEKVGHILTESNDKIYHPIDLNLHGEMKINNMKNFTYLGEL